MDASSYLNPETMKAQCAKAISSLEKDNESLDTVNTSLDTFVNNGEIQSSAFDTLKQQLSDYKTITQAINTANESDMADYETLEGAVGDDVLDGEIILTNKENAREAQVNNEEAAEQYQDMSLKEENPIVSAYYKVKEWHYSNLADIDQRLYEKWQEKEDKYDAIEKATSGLFGSSEGLRAAIDTGISDIAGAFQGGAYVPNMDAPWRETIKTELKKVTISMLPEIMDNLSNKSISEMSPSELEQYGMVVDLILSGEVSEKDMTMIIDAFYGDSVIGQRRRKESAEEFVAYINEYVKAKAKYGLATEQEMQIAMLMQAALGQAVVHELGDVTYKDGVYTFDYIEVTDVSYMAGTVRGKEKHTIEVGEAAWIGDGVTKADNEGDRLLGDLLGFSVGNKVKDTISDQIKAKITEIIVEKTGSEVLEKGFIVTDIVIDWAEDYGTASLGEKIASLDNCGPALECLELYYVSAMDGGVGNYQTQVYPSANTQNLIDEFNKLLSEENQITYEEVMNDPHGVAEKLKSIEKLAKKRRDIEEKLRREGRWL